MISEDVIALDKHYRTLYPSQHELLENDERLSPSMHYYACLGTKSILIRQVRKKYLVCSRGWKGGKDEIQIKAGYYNLHETENFETAKSLFYKELGRMTNGVLISNTNTSKKRADYQRTMQELLQL